MNPELRIKETAPIDVKGGFLINGFPSTGITSAIAAEFIPVRLGSRILRTETASLAALSAVQMLWGDFV